MSIGINRIKRIISFIMALLLFLLAAGCGPAGEPAGGKPAKSEASDVPQKNDAYEDEDTRPDPGDNNIDRDDDDTAELVITTPAEAYAAYSVAKNELVSLITEALTSNSGLALESMHMMGPVMIDLLVLPASLMGLGEIAAASGLSVIGATDVTYSENGNQYKITYSDQEGKKTEFTGTYDAAKDAFACEVLADDGGKIYYEYRRTPFGYVSQVYNVSEDETELFQFSIHEKGGVLGISYVSDKPAALTGNEPKDFPTDCRQWYSIDGTTVTGVASDGREFEFEYIPESET